MGRPAPLQASILTELAAATEEPTTRELAAAVYRHLRTPLYADPPAETVRVTHALTTLLGKGHVERLYADGRVARWKITDAGRRHIGER